MLLLNYPAKMILWFAFLRIGKLRLREGKELAQISKVHKTCEFQFGPFQNSDAALLQHRDGRVCKQLVPPQPWQLLAVPRAFPITPCQLSGDDTALLGQRNSVPQPQTATRPIILPHTLSLRRVQAVPSSGSASWAHVLGSLRRAPCLPEGSPVVVLNLC